MLFSLPPKVRLRDSSNIFLDGRILSRVSSKFFSETPTYSTSSFYRLSILIYFLLLSLAFHTFLQSRDGPKTFILLPNPHLSLRTFIAVASYFIFSSLRLLNISVSPYWLAPSFFLTLSFLSHHPRLCKIL